MHCCISLASADAYLTPCIKEYIRGFTAGFQEGIQVCYIMWRKSLHALQTCHGRYYDYYDYYYCYCYCYYY